VDVAVFELDKKIAACGITTMYHSLSFAELEVGLRSNSTAAGIIRRINECRHTLKVRTRIHARFEITDMGAVPYLEGLIRDGLIDLFSFMDHSPGQGQFRDISSFKSYYGPVYGKSDREMDGIIHRKLRSRENDAPLAIGHLVGMCRKNGIAIASHDDDSREKIEWLKRMGIAMTEFPVNIEVAGSPRIRHQRLPRLPQRAAWPVPGRNLSARMPSVWALATSSARLFSRPCCMPYPPWSGSASCRCMRRSTWSASIQQAVITGPAPWRKARTRTC
jgi:alpha-D-ribose 1-methylphosphonate 5-triphosphate diphosphatase